MMVILVKGEIVRKSDSNQVDVLECGDKFVTAGIPKVGKLQFMGSYNSWDVTTHGKLQFLGRYNSRLYIGVI